jgi:hypothetical protein
LTDGTIDVERGIKLAVDFARDELGKTQPYLATFALTIREWLMAGGEGRLSFNADGSRRQ